MSSEKEKENGIFFYYGNNKYKLGISGVTGLMSGLRASGKSHYTKSMAAAVVSGEVVDGWEINMDGVHYIDLEMHKSLSEAIISQKLDISSVTKAKFKEKYSYTNLADLASPKDKYKKTCDIISNSKRQFIIVDNLTNMSNDSNSQNEGSEIITKMVSLAIKEDKFILMVAHNAQDGTPYGVVGKKFLDGCSIALSLERDMNENFTKVETIKSRFSTPPVYDFSFDENNRVVLGPYIPFPLNF